MTVEFSYRPDNLRLKRTKGTNVNYLIWDGGQIVAELNGTGELTDCYAYGLERIKSKRFNYFVQNGQGDIVHYTNNNGKIMTSYSYDGEYDNVTGGNSNNPFRYRGEYYDTDLRLYYLRARWYDSALGEFISEDPVKDGVNWYVYCANNPVKFRDPSGLAPSPTEAAEMASHIYGDIIDDIDEDLGEAFGGWVLTDLYGNDQGLKMGVYTKIHDDGYIEYAIVNRGTSTWGSANNLSPEAKNNAQMGFGLSKDEIDSMKYSINFVNQKIGYEVTMVGHSKGGAEAILNALATNTNCITFNPFAQSIDTKSKSVKNYTKEMVHFVVKGEILNSLSGKPKVGATIYLNTQVWETKNPTIFGIKIGTYKAPDFFENHNMSAVKSGLRQKGYYTWANVV